MARAGLMGPQVHWQIGLTLKGKLPGRLPCCPFKTSLIVVKYILDVLKTKVHNCMLIAQLPLLDSSTCLVKNVNRSLVQSFSNPRTCTHVSYKKVVSKKLVNLRKYAIMFCFKTYFSSYRKSLTLKLLIVFSNLVP